MRKNKQKVDN